MEQHIATINGKDSLFCSEHCLVAWMEWLSFTEQTEVATGPPANPIRGSCKYCSALMGG